MVEKFHKSPRKQIQILGVDQTRNIRHIWYLKEV